MRGYHLNVIEAGDIWRAVFREKWLGVMWVIGSATATPVGVVPPLADLDISLAIVLNHMHAAPP